MDVRSVSARWAGPALGGAMLLVASCGAAPSADVAPPADPSATPTTVAVEPCARPNLTTIVSGSLTVATSTPAPAPWFEDDDPENGRGFEAALVEALAEELGFSRMEIDWVPVRGAALDLVAGATPSADLVVDRIALGSTMPEAISISSPYYVVNQALVVRAPDRDSFASVADLSNARLGALGAAATAFAQTIAPRVGPQELASVPAAASALTSGEVDGVIVDLPQAGELLDRDPGLALAGQFAPEPDAEALGIALAPGNPLAGCVSEALDRLQAAGTLQDLQDEWLARGTARNLSIG